jgi:hypothetical protein
MKNHIILIASLLIILATQHSFSQNRPNSDNNREKQSAFSQFAYSDKVAFKLDYFGELGLHPGLSLGIDYTLVKKKWLTVHWDSELGGYWHRWNNTSLFLKTSIGTRLPIASFFVDLNLGAGYLHSFAAGTIYQKSSDGGLQRATNWGHSHFMPSTSFLIGWDGTRKMKLPWTFHIGVEAYLQSSFNHIFLPHVAAKVGITYKFKR